MMHNLKISSRLFLGFGSVLLLVGLLGGLALQSIGRIITLMNDLSDHPLRVIDELQQAKVNIITIQRDIRDMTRNDFQHDPEELARNIGKMNQELDAHLEVIRAQYLGPKEDVSQLMRNLDNWRLLIEKTMSLERIGGQAEAIAKVEVERRKYAAEVENKLLDILSFARAKANSFRVSAEAEKSLAFKRLIAAMAALVAVGLLIAALITRSITRPIDVLRRRMTALAAGELSVDIPFQQGKSELTSIACAVQIFKESALKLESQRWI